MAQMNRNVNLEEIDSDALFGIEALKNQTLVQKLVFFTELETVTKLYLDNFIIYHLYIIIKSLNWQICGLYRNNHFIRSYKSIQCKLS